MILKATIDAFRGRNRWIKLKRIHLIEKNGVYVIFMPDDDRDLNEAALRNIDRFLNYRKGNSVVILTTDAWVLKNAADYSKRIIAVETITERDLFYYISYYNFSYFGFSDRFVLMSLKIGRGTRLAIVENINTIIKEEMVCLGLYIIRDWA